MMLQVIMCTVLKRVWPMPSSYFLMIISWEQLSLDLEVNVDGIAALYYSYINKFISVKFFA